MSSIGQPERATQNRAIELFRDELGYRYLGEPVNPMKTALGITAFITRCSLPLCVRWHSSTNTNTSPHGRARLPFEFLDEPLEIIHVLSAKLVH
jgi:hypothetical protein